MKRTKNLLFLVGVFFILIVQAYQKDGLFENLKLLTNDYFGFQEGKEQVFADENECLDPKGFKIDNISDTQVTFSWNGNGMTKWEYYIQEEGIGLPPVTGAPTTTVTTITATQDSAGNTFSDNTSYEYYVRVVCADGTLGKWLGPYVFKTKCSPFTTLPFKETFNTQSATYDCWTILNGGGTWQRSSTAYEGDRAMYYSSTASAVNDSWLVSPAFSIINTNIYELSFYYRTNTSLGGEFELLMSNKGISKTDFTMTLIPATRYTIGAYTKMVYHVTGYTGNVNFAWRVKGTGTSNTIYVDLFNLEKVDCISPDFNKVKISNVTSSNAVATWVDNDNTRWEYFVTTSNAAAPTGAGSSTAQKSLVINTLNGGGALQPNTEYDFYVRSNCSSASKSKWIGPVKFRTLCTVQPSPFFEGFNTGSPTINCWTTIAPDAGYTWRSTTTTKYEGDAAMYYYAYNADKKHNAWLISPSISVAANKYYRISFYYRTDTYYKTDFDVRLSTTGTDLISFTTLLGTQKNDLTGKYTKLSYVISGHNGNINIGFNVNGKESYQYFYIDAFNVEEVACPEPNNPTVENIGKTSFDITWDDKISKDWEYVVQSPGGGIPTVNGTATKNTKNNITKDSQGNTITANTAYEYYVRAKCATGDSSIWIGPIAFRTLCDIVALPFWEGFNKDSSTIYCWDIKNNKTDQSAGTWRQYNYGQYEGSHAMYFYYYDYNKVIEANDWLISPTFKLDAKKIYRVKYHYRISDYYDDGTNQFEVLASNTGTSPTNFTKEVVKKKVYNDTNTYKQETAFISNYGGDVNLAWHVVGKGSKTIYIDNVFLEEVLTCPEPLNLSVSNEKKDQVDINWTDDFGASSFEYYVQEMGKGTPAGKGTQVSAKTATVKTEASGTVLKPNTEYEFYVRTVCADGSNSIWSGPFTFITTCDVFTPTFWEGFNSGETSIRCWSVINNTKGGSKGDGEWFINSYGAFEGDSYIGHSVYDWDNIINSDSYLVSPTIVSSSAGMYVVKYHYKSASYYGGDLEVLLSTQGTTAQDFTQTIVTKTKYLNDNWTEKVAFFNAPVGTFNIAFRMKGTGYQMISLDNVFVKKVNTCPEPYYVKVTNSTTTTIDLTWQQDLGITSWEVAVMNYGDNSSATPLQTVNVTGTPNTTITGLQAGKAYTFYVRAKCGTGNTTSDWSSTAHGGTKTGANDDCTGAVNVPVNSTLECEVTVSASLNGATLGAAPPASCSWSTFRNDIWFEFTATSSTHQIKLLDFIGVGNENYPSIGIALYDQPCGSQTASLMCNTYSPSPMNKMDVGNLIPGRKYYIRVGSTTSATANYLFKLCIGTPKYSSMEVSVSGDKYTVEELVKDVLVNSNCDLVSNVTHQVGDGSPATLSVNSIAYFNKAKSIFPFKEGIVLSTGEAKYVPGPFTYGNKGSNPHRWVGDKDLNDAINSAGGNPEYDGRMRVTQLEFDFIPVKDNLKFDYLFASNSYISGCTYTCANGALFAAWLIDLTTGEGQNLAKIKDTNTPIALGNVWDSKKITGTSCSVNPDYFWKNYTSDIEETIEAPFNFAGSTTDMSSETVKVIPGRKYHIKLAVMDFCTNNDHTSAVFFSAGSFDLGNLDLGKDLTVENENALCSGEGRTIHSGLVKDEENLEIKWFRDGVEIAGENDPSLYIDKTGVYTVIGYYKQINCSVTGEITAEIYPAIDVVVNKPENFSICRYVTEPTSVDLTLAAVNMFKQEETDEANYEVSYYLDKKANEEILDPVNFMFDAQRENKTFYIRVEDIRTGCVEIFSFDVIIEKGEVPQKPSNVLVCAEYKLPEVTDSQKYFTLPGGKGTMYKGGDVLQPGLYDLYLHQNNGGTCYEEVGFTVEVTKPIELFRIEDITLECELFVLPELPKNNKYFIEVEGNRVELLSGTTIYHTNTTVFIVAESDNKVCYEETSFVVGYNDCPIPKGFSPNGDGINDTFDLSSHGATDVKIYNRNGTEVYSFKGVYINQWDGTSKGKELPSGTYFYVIKAFDKTRTGWVELNR